MTRSGDTINALARRVLLVVLVSGAATAQTRTSSTAASTTRDQARALALSARQAFNDGHFAVAAELLERAWALEPSPTLLYNLGRAHQQAGQKAKAISAWERYLSAVPDAADAGAIRTSIQQLRDELATEARLTEQARVEKARAEREAAERARAVFEKTRLEQAAGSRPSVIPWVLSGVGVAGIGAGIAFGQFSVSAHSAAVSEPTALVAYDKQTSAHTWAMVANTAYVAGAALLVAGLAWGLYSALFVTPVATVDVRLGFNSLQVSAWF